MNAPNFGAVAIAFQKLRDEREQDVLDAECALRLADTRLHYADLAKDRRLWTVDEDSEYRVASIEYLEAEQALQAAREAL